MFEFTVNGTKVSTEKDIKLMEFLREDLGLKSVKNGCSEGACGTCTVVVDGKATKSCVMKTSRAVGKNIITVEGLEPYEKDVFAYAFTKVGAVQCGFCTPGMVMSGKALIDSNPNPTKDDIKNAIKNNICRCTGYIKIEEAILLAAKLFREKAEVPKVSFTGNVGENMFRVDAHDKVLGTSEYPDDIKVSNMIYGSAVRSKYPRAIVKSIDISKAKEYPGVVGVFTADDIPGKQVIGHIKQDWDVLVKVGDTTKFLGDAIVLVAAETKEALEAAKELVEIEFEELKPLTNPQEAMAEGAPLVHTDLESNILVTEHLVRGNADEIIANSKYKVTHKYSTPFTEHAFLEPETSVAEPEGDGVVIYSADQGIYQTRKECSAMLGIEPEKVRVVNKTVGGGFGGKEDMVVQHHAALIAYLTKRPVKVSLTRKESILIHPKRHAMEMEFTTACDEDGKLTAMKAVLIADTGAYASLGGPVLQRACTHAAGPYNYQVIDILGKAVYTNNPPGGAFRGFGVTQSCFATESNLDELAQMVGITPWEIRYRNAIRPGQVLPNGQIADESTALVETLEAVKDEFDNNKYVGIACAMKNSGVGVGLPDTGRCRLIIENGVIHNWTGATCIGQGLATAMTQILCETAGVDPDKVIHHFPDTSFAPDSGSTTASRQTVFSGEATRIAAQKLKEVLDTGKTLEDLNGEEFFGEYLGVTDKMGSDKPNPVSHIAYGYATQLVVLNEEGKIEKVVAAHDVGKAINPISLEGQIEGGVVMSLGYALTEDYPLDNCTPTAKYGTLGLFKATQVPEIEPIIIAKNINELAYGAKGIGEISSIPGAPAVRNAYLKFDGKARYSLPLEETPYSRKKK